MEFEIKLVQDNYHWLAYCDETSCWGTGKTSIDAIEDMYSMINDMVESMEKYGIELSEYLIERKEIAVELLKQYKTNKNE